MFCNIIFKYKKKRLIIFFSKYNDFSVIRSLQTKCHLTSQNTRLLSHSHKSQAFNIIKCCVYVTITTCFCLHNMHFFINSQYANISFIFRVITKYIIVRGSTSTFKIYLLCMCIFFLRSTPK